VVEYKESPLLGIENFVVVIVVIIVVVLFLFMNSTIFIHERLEMTNQLFFFKNLIFNILLYMFFLYLL